MLTVDFSKIPLRAGMRILDAGCGSGRHICAAFNRPGVEVIGVDLNLADLGKAKGFLTLMAAENGGHWLVSQADVTKLPFRNNSFDAVVCSEVLEHVRENRVAVAELIRVLKADGDLVVTVPRFFPERICWAISKAYHSEPGGHIRIYKKQEMLNLLGEAGAHCRLIRYRHGLHSPYWWLKCLVGHKNDHFCLVRAYRRFLEWDIICRPRLTAVLDRLLNPLIGKSIVFYTRKGIR